MNEVRTLLEKYWVCKDFDKETYYKVKHDIPLFQKFAREQLGWKLIQTERLIKLEKIPAHAEGFMGIQEFSEIRDYCIFCAVLIFLEDKEEQEQFLLSELIVFVEANLHERMEVDWTSFSQRKSLVRVLQFMERLKMLQVYEGSSEAFGQEAGQEVLYENTGYSKYFATSFARDISAYTSWQDFERPEMEELDADRGQLRVNRVYRQLTACPAMYWDSTEDVDSLYLRNQRKWVAQHLEENLGGRLDIHKNAAFWMLEEDPFGKVHPRDAMLPEAVLIVCADIQERLRMGEWRSEENECIYVREELFDDTVWRCRDKWQSAWSKEFREMEREKLLKTVKDYMMAWMLIRREGEVVRIFPAAGKMMGFYPHDFVPKGDGVDE